MGRRDGPDARLGLLHPLLPSRRTRLHVRLRPGQQHDLDDQRHRTAARPSPTTRPDQLTSATYNSSGNWLGGTARSTSPTRSTPTATGPTRPRPVRPRRRPGPPARTTGSFGTARTPTPTTRTGNGSPRRWAPAGRRSPLHAGTTATGWSRWTTTTASPMPWRKQNVTHGHVHV